MKTTKKLILTVIFVTCSRVAADVNPPETFVEGLGNIGKGAIQVGTLGIVNPEGSGCEHHKSGKKCTDECHDRCHSKNHHCKHHHADERCSRKCSREKCETKKEKGGKTKSSKKSKTHRDDD